MKTLSLFCIALGLFSHSAIAEPKTSPEDNPQIVYAVAGSGKSVVNLAVEYMRPRKNGVAILITDGYKDEIEGKEIAELFIKWFDEKYKLRVMCFVESSDEIRYSGVSFIVGDIPYGPWNLMDAKNNMDTIVAAYIANIQLRQEAETNAKKESWENS